MATPSAHRQTILQDDRAYLANLVGLCGGALGLQVDSFDDARAGEYMVASPLTLSEPQVSQQRAEIDKGDVRYRLSIADAVQ